MVRIHIPRTRGPGHGRTLSWPLGPAIGSLLAPLALTAYLLCAARIGTDLGLLQLSAPEGVWSHWQVWMAVAVSSHLFARRLLETGGTPPRRAGPLREARAKEEWNQKDRVNDRVKEMVKEALAPYERVVGPKVIPQTEVRREDRIEDEVTQEVTPLTEHRPVFRFAKRSPIAEEAEALRRRLRRY